MNQKESKQIIVTNFNLHKPLIALVRDCDNTNTCNNNDGNEIFNGP
jgi:hypothetical protein